MNPSIAALIAENAKVRRYQRDQERKRDRIVASFSNDDNELAIQLKRHPSQFRYVEDSARRLKLISLNPMLVRELFPPSAMEVSTALIAAASMEKKYDHKSMLARLFWNLQYYYDNKEIMAVIYLFLKENPEAADQVRQAMEVMRSNVVFEPRKFTPKKKR